MHNLIKRVLVVCSLALALGMFISPMNANAKKQSKSPEEAMTRMIKLSSPGEHHKVLDTLAGTWNYEATFRMTPDSKAQTMTGTSENKWILGGRFIQQAVKGQSEMMPGKPQPFEGIGLLGYDNVKKEYTTIWADNMATGMMEATAHYEPETKTMTEKGTFSCPMTGEKHMKYRAVWKIVDNDHYTYEMYTHTPKGKEFKSMEITFTRAS